MAPKIKKRQKATAQSKPPASPSSFPSSKTTASSQHAEDHSNVCTICAETARDLAVGNCAHVVCGDCSHRMRVLYDRKNCVMCNEILRQVAVVPLRHYRTGMTFQEAVSLPGAFHDKQVDMWFIERSRYQQLRHVRGFKCSHKSCMHRASQDSVFSNATQLRAHARSEHRTIYCEICLTGKKRFVSEMPQYSLDNDRNYSSRLRGHLRKDHPQCRFCRHYYLDDEKLYAHLQERHETCSVCERNGRMHEYYLNFEQLEGHYAKEHYVCKHDSCRGVVFSTQIELQTHEHTRHNEGNRSNRSRAFRVDLAQLHGARDPQRPSSSTAREVERERELQAARRRAFLSSNVVFSGAFNLDDTTEDPLPGESPEPSSAQPSSRTSRHASQPSDAGTATSASVAVAVPATSHPDDGRFHPLELPRNGEEFQARNTLIVRKMRSLLDPAAYEHFKHSSGKFRVGDISADEYYNAAVDTFGVRSAVRDVLPELVALLPSHLLREPLLQTCLRRTDTKPEDVGHLDMTTPATGSSSASSQNGSGAREEQFPSLSGSSAPPRRITNPRRFGTPGPEEFPRLNRAYRPRKELESGEASLQQESTQSSYATASGSAPVSRKGGSDSQQRTAASVLRQPPVPQRIFGKQPAVGSSSRGAGPSGHTSLHEGAFPALGAASVSRGNNRPLSATENSHAPSGQHVESENPVSADLSMRVGAVWGGAAARTHERAGRKRGPGRGRGKQPASPPRSVLLSTADFPDVRGKDNSHLDNPTGVTSNSASRGDASSQESNHAATSKNRVIDVAEISRTRQNATMKSNLPKVGGSGYGFAWDRKKVQRKKKEIKEGVSKQVNRKYGSNDQERFPWGSPSNMSVTASGSRAGSTMFSVTSPSTSAVEEAVQKLCIDETQAASTSDHR